VETQIEDDKEELSEKERTDLKQSQRYESSKHKNIRKETHLRLAKPS